MHVVSDRALRPSSIVPARFAAEQAVLRLATILSTRRNKGQEIAVRSQLRQCDPRRSLVTVVPTAHCLAGAPAAPAVARNDAEVQARRVP